jgi:hypothetical protein
LLLCSHSVTGRDYKLIRLVNALTEMKFGWSNLEQFRAVGHAPLFSGSVSFSISRWHKLLGEVRVFSAEPGALLPCFHSPLEAMALAGHRIFLPASLLINLHLLLLRTSLEYQQALSASI